MKKPKQNERLLKLQEELNRVSNQYDAQFEIITPRLAGKYLAKNFKRIDRKNRTIHNPTVNKYVNDIRNDRWRVAAPIVFDTTGSLIDGQTRCTAVIKANEPILSLVIRGADPDSFDGYDNGKNRTPKNILETILSEKGEKLIKPGGVSSGIALLRNVEKKHKSIDKNRGSLTNPEFLEMVKNNFDYYNFPFKKGKLPKWRRKIKAAVAENILSGFYFKHKKVHGNDVDDFLDLITDINTPAVVAKFRDMMIEAKRKKSDERGYLPPHKVYFLVETLFKYSQEPRGLYRKNFTQTDMQELNNL